jgi:hypothetical protein
LNNKTNNDDTSDEEENHTVLIVGDSHTRQCASKVKNKLSKTYIGTGFVKPGSNILVLKNSAKGAIQI